MASRARNPRHRPFLLLSLGGGCVLLLNALWIWLSLPEVSVLRKAYPVVQYRGPEVPPLVMIQKARPASWVGLREISRPAISAILLSEDSAFYQHHGYDMGQIREAIETDLERRSFSRGASTITQQVVRNVFLSKEKNLWRKAKELYLATKLDEAVGKGKILETYFNIAEWGPGIFGIVRASEYYFGKRPSQLTAKEGAFLAMLLPSPIRYGQSFRQHQLTDYAAETMQDILGKMVQVHELTEEEKSAEWSRPLSFESIDLEKRPVLRENF